MSLLSEMEKTVEKIIDIGGKGPWWARCGSDALEAIAKEKGCLKKDKKGLYVDTGKFHIRIKE